MSRCLLLLVRVIVLFPLMSCATDNKPKKTSQTIQDVDGKFVRYLALSRSQQDQNGYITKKCDMAFHTALYAAATGLDIDFTLIRNEDGQLFRTWAKDCLATGRSRSTFSRDPWLALLLVSWVREDLDYVERMIKYVEDHDGKIGDHDGSASGLSRVVMTPQLLHLAYRVRHKLGGDAPPIPKLPEVYSDVKGSDGALQVLFILVSGLVDGGIDERARNQLNWHKDNSPRNAFFHAVRDKFTDGDQAKAIELIMDERLYPADRLPQSSDRCSNYLHTRDDANGNYEPCGDDEIHPGHDFLIVSAIILGKLKY